MDMTRSALVFELREQNGHERLREFDFADLLLDTLEDHSDIECAFTGVLDVCA